VLSFLIKSGFEITEVSENPHRIKLTQPEHKTHLIVNFRHNPSLLVAVFLYPEEMVLDYISNANEEEFIASIHYTDIFSLSISK
jgi:hypothetical protein